MKLRYITYLIICLVSAMAMAGCVNSDGRVTDEGIIEYEISYPMTWSYNKEKDNLLSLFPKKVNLYFKDNSTALYIGNAFFKIRYVSRYDEGRNYASINIPYNGDNMVIVQDSSQSAFGYDDMADISYTYTEDTLTVAGYLCKKAVAHCPKKNLDINIWYTKNIKILNANTNTAFKNLDGVPMKFDIILMDFYMQLEADDVKYDKISDDYLVPPYDFKQGNKADMKEFMQRYMRNN